MSQFQFKRTGDADYPRHLKVMVQGPPKSGKTSFIATAPNVVVAAAEAGLMSIAHLNIPYVDIDDYSKLETLLLVLRDETMRQRAATQMGLPKIETVAIDTLDAVQEIIKVQILKENRRTQMQQADWGTLKERMAALLKAFIALPLNVIFTVHTDVTSDENGRQIYAPLLQGSIKNDVAGYVDFSLMSKREKQTMPDGTSKLVYFLQNEGDDKNPHLGNRGAGRIPEVCTPDFQTLHKLTFDGINLPKTQTIEIQEEVEPVVEEPAVVESQEVRQVTGVPPAPSMEKINAAGISALTKAYTSAELVVPPDLGTWDLDKARRVAKMFSAIKADIATGKSTREELHTYLGNEGAFYGVADVAGKPKPEKKTPKKAEPKVTPEPEEAEGTLTHEEAEAVIEQEMGGQVLFREIGEDATCEVCKKPIDDPEVAKLGLGRFRKVLCVDDYMKINEEGKK